jgi:acyl-CoA synthetase (AMP-forming)/AMP-acid ligase II
MAPGRFSHSLFLFGMVLGLWSGAGVVVQERFSAPRLLETLRTGRTPCLVAVPSQLLLMLELAARRQLAPIDGVRLILISGARWMRDRTEALQALFPKARIVEFYGASETSFMAWMDADASAPPHAVGKPFSNVEIDIRQPQPPLGTGQIFVRSPMLFTDYVGAANDHTAAVRDGEWLSVRDMGYVDAQGYFQKKSSLFCCHHSRWHKPQCWACPMPFEDNKWWPSSAHPTQLLMCRHTSWLTCVVHS